MTISDEIIARRAEIANATDRLASALVALENTLRKIDRQGGCAKPADCDMRDDCNGSLITCRME